MREIRFIQRIYENDNIKRLLLIILIAGLMVQTLPHQSAAVKYEDINNDLNIIAARITDVDWTLTTLYEEYDALDIVINLTLVKFTIEIEIWNTNESDQTIVFGSSDEFPLRIETSLIENQLELTPYWVSLTVMTPRTYSPGVIRKTREYPFVFENPNVTRLPNGDYRLDLASPLQSKIEEKIVTYGANLTVTPMEYIIDYHDFPEEIEGTSPYLTYSISDCKNEGGFPDWNDGEVNVTVRNSAIYFTQLIVNWCNFDSENFTIEMEVNGDKIELRENYDATVITDCLCLYQIEGKINNLVYKDYTLYFQYQTYVNNNPESRFSTETKVELSEKGILTPGFEIFVIIILLIGAGRKKSRYL